MARYVDRFAVFVGQASARSDKQAGKGSRRRLGQVMIFVQPALELPAGKERPLDENERLGRVDFAADRGHLEGIPLQDVRPHDGARGGDDCGFGHFSVTGRVVFRKEVLEAVAAVAHVVVQELDAIQAGEAEERVRLPLRALIFAS